MPYQPRRNRRDGLCPRCGERPRGETLTGRPRKYCLPCTRRYKRAAWAAGKGRPVGDARRRAICRSYTRVLITRGVLKRLPCEVCDAAAGPHHLDYDNPYLVRWLCRTHHLAAHA